MKPVCVSHKDSGSACHHKYGFYPSYGRDTFPSFLPAMKTCFCLCDIASSSREMEKTNIFLLLKIL